MPPPADDLGARVVRGVSWRGASQVVRQLTRVLLLLVLARSLSPHEYGVAAMVLVVSTLVLVFSDLGLGAALVQRADLDDLDRSSVFWATSAVGLAATALCWLVAGPAAAFYGEPAVRDLMRGLSATFLLTALGATQVAVLSRDLRYRELALRQIAAALAGTAARVGLALGGAGAWAVIGQQLAVAAASTALVWTLGDWRPGRRASWSRVRSLASFGLAVFVSRLGFYANRNADNLLVGKVLGSGALGIYGLAYQAVLLPLEQVGGPVAEVLFPALARLQGTPARLRAAWLRAVRLLALVVAPGLGLLIVLADDLVRILLGPAWSGVAPVVQLLAWVGLHQTLQRLNSSVLQAVGAPRVLASFALLSVAVNVPAFVIGLHWGVTGVAAAYAVSSTIVAPVYLVRTCRAAGLAPSAFLRAVAPILLVAAACAGAAWLTRTGLLGLDVRSPVARVLLAADVGAICGVLTLRAVAPAVAREAWGLLPRGLGRRLRARLGALRPPTRRAA